MSRLLVILTITLTGCVPQSNMIHKTDQVEFEPRLVGVWESAERTPKLTVEVRRLPQDDKGYHVQVINDQGTGTVAEFGAMLSRIDGKHYLTIGNLDKKQNARYSTIVVDEFDPKITVRFLKRDWMFMTIAANPKLIAHSGNKEKDFLLTASTEELLAFYQKHLNDKQPWETFVFVKKQ